MMRLITGVPGAGKTLFAVSEILKVAKENERKAAAGEEPRDIYTNIEGINIPGVTYTTERDWRTFPDGSLIVYDEAHQLFRATGRPGLSDDPIISDMDMHRHRGFDLWFITQFPTKVHHEIRNMVDEHYHLLRQFGAKQATIYKWPESADVKDPGARSVADTEFFRYPKECFQYYKSASVHTAKLRIPAKVKFLFTVIALIFSFV
ncbi:MAG: zonular occludens toxin domain-containing protein, partial [Candidatus Methanomethylicaceae archaeon]